MGFGMVLGMLLACRAVTPEPSQVPSASTPLVAPADKASTSAEAVRIDLPDLSGSWEGRGLLPFRRPALWALEHTEMTEVSQGMWRFTTEIDLHTRDRVRKVGHASMVGTTSFQGGKACSTLTKVDLEVEDWTGEIPLGAQVKEAIRPGGSHRHGCGKVEVSAEELTTYRGDLAWTEKRP